MIVEPVEGPVTAAVRTAVNEVAGNALDGVRVALAISLASRVDGGSVPAAGQLRGVLDDLEKAVNAELDDWIALISTPRPQGRDES